MDQHEPRYALVMQCPKCGHIFGSGVVLAPGASARLTGNRTSCPACRRLVPVPDGDYSVIDGAVRWVRAITDSQQRDRVIEAARAAMNALNAGVDAPVVMSGLEHDSGLKVPEFLLGAKSGTLAAWIAVLLTLLTWWQSRNQPPVEVHQTVNQTTITVVVPNGKTR